MSEHLADRFRISDALARQIIRKNKALPKGKHSQEKKSFVYVAENPAWPGWVKIGHTRSPRTRLANYNLSSPFKDYKLSRVAFCPFYREVEKYGEVTHEEYGPRGGWKSVTFGEVNFRARHLGVHQGTADPVVAHPFKRAS